MVNALGTGCGFICNVLMGRIYDATHSYPLTMLPIVGFVLVGTVVLLVLGQARRVPAPA
jgi:MFS-type transporter involved in bile tolerance (Atg22 family)